jgi:hypothetical protein
MVSEVWRLKIALAANVKVPVCLKSKSIIQLYKTSLL